MDRSSAGPLIAARFGFGLCLRRLQNSGHGLGLDARQIVVGRI